MATAWQRVSAWLSADPVWMPAPTERHADVLGQLLVAPGVHGNLVPDAHLAALAIEHGLTLCSTDGDFARFPGCAGSIRSRDEPSLSGCSFARAAASLAVGARCCLCDAARRTSSRAELRCHPGFRAEDSSQQCGQIQVRIELWKMNAESGRTDLDVTRSCALAFSKPVRWRAGNVSSRHCSGSRRCSLGACRNAPPSRAALWHGARWPVGLLL